MSSTAQPVLAVASGSRIDGHRNAEKPWLERFEFLKSRGYLFRPRYRPGWIPPWVESGLPTMEYEDGITSLRVNTLDAIRVSDGRIVILKHTAKDSPEVTIGRFLMSEALRKDPKNHAIPILDVLEDDSDPDNVILVLPLLRRLDSPYLASVREAVDFIGQTLEGLVFLHEHKIAHRDCAWENIMMDSRAMFPDGWHPQRWLLKPDATPLDEKEPSRTAAGGVKYYYIDFGISSFNQDMVLGIHGQEEAPELSDSTPYDPYKLDVYVLGMVFQRYIIKEHKGSDFVMPLVQYMTPENPHDRPSASQALDFFRKIQSSLSERDLSRRLTRHNLAESTFTRSINDTLYRIHDYLWRRREAIQLPPLAP